MDFEIKINGIREGEPISPNQLDVDEWIAMMEYAKQLLLVETKERPRISVRVEAGSVRLVYSTAAKLVVQVHALLEEVKRTGNLAMLSKKQRNAIQFFQRFAIQNKLTLTLGKSTDLERGLVVDQRTSWEETNPVWVQAELYLKGVVTSLGGKRNPNVHLDTKRFGSLIVAAKEQYLATDQENRLYKQQEIRVTILQNPENFSYDTKSIRLIEFVSHPHQENQAFSTYLNDLIHKAALDWIAIANTTDWLKAVRGYE